MSRFDVFDGPGDPIAHDPAWRCAYTDAKNERFRSIEVLRGPRGRIEDRVMVRAAMEREKRGIGSRGPQICAAQARPRSYACWSRNGWTR